MRDLSVYQLKRQSRGQRILPLQHKPCEGTIIRQVYDLLMANAGKSVALFEGRNETKIKVVQTSINRLGYEYGLDIRLTQHGWKKSNRPALYVLAGEWFGKIYVDYIADTEEQMDLIANARIALAHSEHPENILPTGVHHLSAKSIEILKRVAAKGREIEEKHSKRGA